MPKTKKFIDKKNSVTFHLVHRSQQDPLAADETAPQRVLVPVCNKNSKQQLNPEQIKKRKEEQQKFGVFFDDDYDYLQHLRDARTLNAEWEQVIEIKNNPKTTADEEKAKINLPSSVFESHVEENVGLLNRAGPAKLQLDLDPEVVAALDDDFNYDDPDNQLEDNFMELANAEGDDDGDSFSNESEDDYEDEMDDEFDDEPRDWKSFKNAHDDAEETKTHFTEYSVTSSVIRRNKQLSMLDDQFEKMFESYDDDNIGELDPEETDGYIDLDPETFLKRVQEDDGKLDIEHMSKRLQNYIINNTDENDDYDLEKLTVGEVEKDRFDCESILSTTSNIYNHPKLISEPRNTTKIKVDRQTGIPANFSSKQSANILSDKNLAKLNAGEQINHPRQLYIAPSKAVSEKTFSSINRKEETKEQKKERKLTCKVMKRERRVERKQNCELFKEERKRQQKIMNNERTSLGNKLL